MASKKSIEEVINVLSEYWQEHQDLDFGQMLDSIMVRKGDIRDMSRLSSGDLIHYIKELMKEEVVFTSEQLDELRLNRLKEYHSSSEAKNQFEKEPIPLFLEGRFVKDNYFGGDDIIRSFFTEISENDEPIMFPEITFDMKGTTYVAGLTAMKIETAHYVNFMFVISGMQLKFQENASLFHVGVFGFEKQNLDNIEFAWFDGEKMTEENYLFILNTLKSTGFNFFIKQPKKLPKPMEEKEEVKAVKEAKTEKEKGKKK